MSSRWPGRFLIGKRRSRKTRGQQPRGHGFLEPLEVRAAPGSFLIAVPRLFSDPLLESAGLPDVTAGEEQPSTTLRGSRTAASRTPSATVVAMNSAGSWTDSELQQPERKTAVVSEDDFPQQPTRSPHAPPDRSLLDSLTSGLSISIGLTLEPDTESAAFQRATLSASSTTSIRSGV